jgi:hypothetical protein
VRRGKRVWAVLPAALLLFTVVSAAFAWDEPVLVPGNPSCQDLGYEYGYRIEPVHTGLYWIPGMGEAGAIWLWKDTVYLKWQTRFGTDIVIVKGGPNANVYYGDEEFWGVGFHAPINPNNGRPYGLSHVEFCWDAPPPCLPGVCQ